MSTLEWLRGIATGALPARVDHPMASLEEARALLAKLPVGRPAACLAEAANWLATVALTPGFPPVLRARVVALIEDRSGPCAAALASEIFAPAGGATEGFAAAGASQQPPEIDLQGVRKLFDYAIALSDAQWSFLASIPAQAAEAEDEMRGMLVRHAHALARRMALRRMLRLPSEPQDWVQLDACYARAAALKSLRTPQAVGGQAANAATVLREYLRAVLFELGAPESLNPRTVWLLYRIAGRQAPAVLLGSERTAGARFAVFPGKGIGPRPAARVSAGSKSARYLDLTQCVAQLRALAGAPAERQVAAADRAIAAEFSAAERKAVFDNAIEHWGADPPHRAENRIELTGEGQIVGGLAAALERLAPIAQGDWLRDSALLGPLASAELANDPKAAAQRTPTPVRVRDASARGLGIAVPRAKCGWLRVGALLGVHVEPAANWAIAQVRRIGASGEDLLVGLEILAPRPRALWVRVPGVESEREWARSKKPLDVAAGLVRGALPAADPRGLVAGQLFLDPAVAAVTENFEVPLPDRLQCIRVVKRLGGTHEFMRLAFALAEARPLPRWARAQPKAARR